MAKRTPRNRPTDIPTPESASPQAPRPSPRTRSKARTRSPEHANEPGTSSGHVHAEVLVQDRPGHASPSASHQVSPQAEAKHGAKQNTKQGAKRAGTSESQRQDQLTPETLASAHNAGRALIVMPEGHKPTTDRMRDAIAARGVHVEFGGQDSELSGFDLVLAHATTPDDVARLAASAGHAGAGLSSSGPSWVVLADRFEPMLARAALRHGALDLICLDELDGEALDRCASTLLDRAFRGKRSRLFTERREARLRNLCVRLHKTRGDLAKQVGSLCNDLALAYRDVSDQLVRVTLTAEFASIARQELDLEALLRVVLEYVLAKIGPTNAAIYLPNTSGDYTLGAYVNYDCPRESAEALMDQLSCTIGPRFQSRKVVETFEGEEQIVAQLGPDAEWMRDAGLMIAACGAGARAQQTGGSVRDCQAVIAVFRDRRNPFGVDARERLQIISEVFGEQLGRVMQVHHRHLPKNQWGAPGNVFDTPPGSPESPGGAGPSMPWDPRRDGQDDIDMAA
ncbi:MAG: hypothetical protein SFZ23_06900 [Planctomycetota bacterium]|nr:hypothetical protein [Planctomycetota bacterium]